MSSLTLKKNVDGYITKFLNIVIGLFFFLYITGEIIAFCGLFFTFYCRIFLIFLFFSLFSSLCAFFSKLGNEFSCRSHLVFSPRYSIIDHLAYQS